MDDERTIGLRSCPFCGNQPACTELIGDDKPTTYKGACFRVSCDSDECEVQPFLFEESAGACAFFWNGRFD